MTYSEIAKQYIGVKQGSKKHKEIVDYYNNIKPLPQGYKMKYTDSWCACFVTVILDKGNGIDIPYECSCRRMLDLCKKKKQTLKDKTQGKPNDIIFYDWRNDGTVDHVGIIDSISDNSYYVIEGNKSRQVGMRQIAKKSNEIEAVARIGQQTDTPTRTSDTMDGMIDTLAKDVIKGKYGTGKQRKELLGIYYADVQKKVNELLKKS